MASPTLSEDEVVAARSREEQADRRLWRQALATALVVHLLLLAAPRPRPDHASTATSGDPRVYPLTDLRPAPPVPPEPVVPEPPEEPAELPPEPDEESPGPPGPPPPPRVEVLFPEGELSRLAPPRPLEVVAPPTPAAAPPEGGEVRIYLQLDDRGEVFGVRGSIGDPTLLEAALLAARSWRFFPATLDGEPIPVVVEVIVRFPPPVAAATPPEAG